MPPPAAYSYSSYQTENPERTELAGRAEVPTVLVSSE